MTVQGVIFDLDGVLVRTDRYHLRSWQVLASQLGLSFDEHTYDTRMRGLARAEALSVFLERAPWPCSADRRAALAAAKDVIFHNLVAQRPLTPVRGAVRLLRELHACARRIAVGSSSRNAHWVLEATGLARHVDAVVDGTEARGKPEPDIFLLAARKLALPPALCLVVEDALDGIEAARRAGMPVLAIGPPERVGCRADRISYLSRLTAARLLSLPTRAPGVK
jgi:beta-phosphoglucomutase